MAELIGNVGLTGIVLIDIAIGLIFAVLTFSLIATALNEAIAGVLNYRGEHLRRGILRLINDEAVAGEVLDHPLIKGLKGPKNMLQKVLHVVFLWGQAARDPDRMPSSIPKDTFARALIESLVVRRQKLRATLEGAHDRAERALDLVSVEIDRLQLDRRLKKRLKAVVGRIDFDRIESQVGARIEGVLTRAEAVADRLGVELDGLGLEDDVKVRVQEAVAGLELDKMPGRVGDAIDAAVGRLDLDQNVTAQLREALAKVDLDAIEAKIDNAVQSALARAEDALEETIDGLERDLAAWFDASMDRVTGWYVRRTKTMLFIIGFASAAAMSFDLIGYGKQLAHDDALRSAIVARAQAAAATGQVGAFSLDAQETSALAEQAAGKENPTEQERTAIRAMSFFDLNDNGQIEPNEVARADEVLRAAFGLVGDQATAAIETVTTELTDQGVTLGASFWAAEWPDKGRMLLSFFLIGLGCTLGGQFWFDLLKTLLRVRAGASGLNSDRERPRRDVAAGA